jgi:hypothetical protein
VPKSSSAAGGARGGGSGVADGAGPPAVCASASAITPSTKAFSSTAGFCCVPANQIALQRARRTVRQAAPSAAGSIM